MSRLTTLLDQYLYPKHADNWDNKYFRHYIIDKLKPDFSILDYGAGRGRLAEMNFRGLATFVAGVDVDPMVLQNPNLDESKTLNLNEEIPYGTNKFDLVFSNSVLEHVKDPAFMFKEIFRVLKPKGLFISKTPNKRHYVAFLARSTPHSFHKIINKTRGREHQDTFPTIYRCNTPKDIIRYADVSGFNLVDLQMLEGRPEYLRIFTPTYLVGYFYERLVNNLSLLRGFRGVIIFSVQKPSIL